MVREWWNGVCFQVVTGIKGAKVLLRNSWRMFGNVVVDRSSPFVSDYSFVGWKFPMTRTMSLDPIQYNTIQYNTIQYNTIQYNTIQ